MTLVLFAAGYVVGFPLLLRLFAAVHKAVVTNRREEREANKPRSDREPVRVLWVGWREQFAFAVKDRRVMGKAKSDGTPPSGPQYRVASGLGWLAGFVMFMVGGATGVWQLLVSGFVVFMVTVGFALHSARQVTDARHKMLGTMAEISRAALGTKSGSDPSQVVSVLEWADPLTPSVVRFTIPPTFNGEVGEGFFLRMFNQRFGQRTTWVPYPDPKTSRPGWDYEQECATFHSMPPLPTRAPWDAHYIEGPEVAWSFFPIALGVENGVEITNPETGEKEHVLGFDMAGAQGDMGKQGVRMGPEIVTAPHVLIGGGTGGGKALAVDTPVLLLSRRKGDDSGTEPVRG